MTAAYMSDEETDSEVMGSLYVDPHGGVILDISRADLSGFAWWLCHTSFDIGRGGGGGGGGGGG